MHERHAGSRARRGATSASVRTFARASPSWTARAKRSAASSSCVSGENALNVIDGVKRKLAEVAAIAAARRRDRRRLRPLGADQRIDRTRCGAPDRGGDHRQPRDHRIPVPLPLGADSDPRRCRSRVLASFIPMYYLGVSSNIMSLGGLALAIGVLVDASIVMVENAYRHLADGRTRDGAADDRAASAVAFCSTRRSRSAARSSSRC